MTGGMAAFLTAVGTSLISCLMVGRRRNRRGLHSHGDNGGGGSERQSWRGGGNLFC